MLDACFWIYRSIVGYGFATYCLFYTDGITSSLHRLCLSYLLCLLCYALYLEEWVPLKRDDGAAPMVRLAHPVTTLKSDGNRKRKRVNASSVSWSVGDHVDARMRDG
jgi:hypothetical protein